MDILDTKTDKELMESLLAEIAKSQNEIKCAQGDILKAQSRIKFATLVVNTLIERHGD